MHVLLTTYLNLKLEIAYVQIVKFHTLHIISKAIKLTLPYKRRSIC